MTVLVFTSFSNKEAKPIHQSMGFQNNFVGYIFHAIHFIVLSVFFLYSRS